MRFTLFPSRTHRLSAVSRLGQAFLSSMACLIFCASAKAQLISPFEKAADPCSGVTDKAMALACNMSRNLGTTPDAAYSAMSVALPLYAAKRCGFGVSEEFERDLRAVAADESAFHVLNVLMTHVLPDSASNVTDFSTFCSAHRASYGPEGTVARYYQ